MSDLRPTEKKFEDHIEKHLNSVGYGSTHFNDYDRNLCLIRGQVIDFIKATQAEKWARLEEIYETDTENKILARISSEVAKRGIVDVLRNQVVDRGVYLDLCYFEPKSDLNADHLRLYQSNKFTVVRQLHYSIKNENSIDMALFLNGLPIATMELKNQSTGQNVKHSENQYSFDRDPKEPLLGFKRCMVHFCVDNDKVSMTTRLAGKTLSSCLIIATWRTHRSKRDIAPNIFGKTFCRRHPCSIFLRTLCICRKKKSFSSITKRKRSTRKPKNYWCSRVTINWTLSEISGDN